METYLVQRHRKARVALATALRRTIGHRPYSRRTYAIDHRCNTRGHTSFDRGGTWIFSSHTYEETSQLGPPGN
eukprot:767441-Prymnesium_polylepis.1